MLRIVSNSRNVRSCKECECEGFGCSVTLLSLMLVFFMYIYVLGFYIKLVVKKLLAEGSAVKPLTKWEVRGRRPGQNIHSVIWQ